MLKRIPKLLALLTIGLLMLLALFAYTRLRPYHATPIEALTEFPGQLSPDTLVSATVLRAEEVAGGQVLLYRYPAHLAEASPDTHCIATTFVTQVGIRGWRAQSASRLGCDSFTAKFTPAFTVGGNITDLTTVYGLAQEGNEVRVEWSDGVISTVPVVDGIFLQSRPETLTVQSAVLLGENGTVLESQTWSN